MRILAGGVRNCVEVQARLGPGEDGEQVVVVGGREISVYCHGMNTTNPREFIREGFITILLLRVSRIFLKDSLQI